MSRLRPLPRLRLNQGDPSEARLYYCSHFVAAELGYFEAAGVTVDFAWAASGGGTVLGGQVPAVIDGSADLAIGGPMLLMRMAEEGGPPLAAFCAAVAGNPWVLVAGADQPGFSLARLAGQRVCDMAAIGTATLTFRWLLQQHGLTDVRLEPGSGDAAADLAAVASGAVYGLQSLHALGPAVADGRVAVVASLAELTGPVPWSAYIARRERLLAEPAAFDAFTRAIGLALAWIHTHSAAEVASLVGRHYPGYPAAGLQLVIAQYQVAGIFAADPLMSPTAFDHFARILTEAGWLRAVVPYQSVVVTRHALAANLQGPRWTR